MVEKAVENGNKKPLEERALIKIHGLRVCVDISHLKGFLVNINRVQPSLWGLKTEN